MHLTFLTRSVGHPTLFGVVFTENAVLNYRDVVDGDSKKATKFQQVLRNQGIFKSPAKLYVLLALIDKDLDLVSDAASQAARSVF